ncbi:MAG: hypothetical protein FGM54_01000, partial [Chitinophagaceae bacterium]|nr:hypothetical protein [Chitinophagaceae bacterium]
MSKRFLKAVMMIVFFLSSFINTIHAQTTVQIGTNGASSSYLYGPLYRSSSTSTFRFSMYAYLYTEAELAAAGITPGSLLNGVQFFKNSAFTISGTNTMNMEVWLSTTASTALTNSVSWSTYTSTATQVHNTLYNSANFPTATGWFNMPFTTAYTYNGGSLIVLVRHYYNTATSPYAGGAINWLYATGYPSNRTMGAAGSAAQSGATILSTTYGGTMRANTRLTYTAGAPCSGVPNPGNTVASTNSVCTGANLTLTLQNSTIGSGVSFQWQSADDASFTTNVVNLGTSPSQTTTQTTDKYYRCEVTCAGNGSAFSNPVFVTMNPFYNCYAASTATSPADEEILGVTLNGLSNNSTCATLAPGPGSVINQYSNYRTLGSLAIIDQGGTAPISLNLGSCGGNYGRAAKVWIDFNQNGSFENPGEMVYSTGDIAGTVLNPTINSGTVNIPVTALAGVTGMRVSYFETTAASITPTLSSSWGEVEDYLVTVQVPAACSGIPVPGNTISSANVVCPNVNFTLSLQNNVSALGISYQWQSADDPSFTVNLTNLGTSSTQTVSQTTAKYYRCEVTCAGNGSDISTPILVNMDAVANCYCIPAANCSFGDLIASVTLNTLVNNSGTTCSGAFVNYTTSTNPSHTTTLLPSSTYNCIVGSGAYTQDYAAWIDYNDDGIFSANERIGYTTTALAANSTASFPITLACTPPAGQHRLRVRSAYLLGGINITPCGSQTYGETEDYIITIAAPPACPDPGALSVTGTTFNSADLSWVLNCASATAWDVQYGPTGFAIGTGTIVSNIPATSSTTITGLSSSTPYQFYIRANCGANGVSNWSLAASGTTVAAPCTGQPNAGTASAPASVCANISIALSATGLTNDIGISYQWESSTDNINWFPIAGATTASYTYASGISTTTWFRLVTTCANSAQSNTTNEVMVTLNPAVSCYCIPVANCSAGDLIASVTLNTLVNNSGTTCNGAYVDYTTSSNPSHTTTLLPSSTYNCVVGAGSWAQDYAAWIDYNDDGIFAATERIGYTTTTLQANQTASFPISLACTPPAGPHRLRVRSAYATPGVNITPCGTQSYGETEDYIITIAAPPACPDPGALSVTAVTSNSADLSWVLNCATATAWDVQY